MASEAAPDDARDGAFDSASKPPEDLVVPPKEVRRALESVAGFVVRNGSSFEDRVRNQHRNDPKTSFLNPNDAYHPYYQWRLSEIRAGRGTDVSAGREGGGAVHPQAPQKPKGPEPPPEFHFSARMPNINAKDLDVVKLTAQYVAKRGRSFITVLSQKEAGNFQFDFLRSSHSLYQYFTHLVDQYSELLDKQKAQKRLEEVLPNIDDPKSILRRAHQRADWIKHQEKQKVRKEEEAEAERIAYAEIDWHDFVILGDEPITFTDADADVDFPPPLSLNDLQSASLETRHELSMASADRRLEEAVPDFNAPLGSNGNVPPPPVALPPRPMAAQAHTGSPGIPAPPYYPPGSASPGQNQQPFAPPPPGQPGMRIRTDYVPRAAAMRNQHANTSICPNCGRHIPNHEMAEHLRIEMLDPNWREQRERANAKFSTTNLNTADVAQNLKRLQSQRSDLFDSDEAARKMQKTGSPGAPGNPMPPNSGPNPNYPNVLPGPLPAQPNPQGMSVQEQIALIRQKAQGGGGANSGGGGGTGPPGT